MTLILTRASAEFVLQVADRRVSELVTLEAADKVANKNILFFASNAVVSLAFTGVAVLDGVPTDHWIAEKLLGMKVDWEEPPSLLMGLRPNRDIGYVIRFLCGELVRLDKRRQIYLHIVLHGWQWDSRGRCRPLLGDIARFSVQDIFRIQYVHRDWYLDGSARTISAPASNMSLAELQELSNQLRGQPSNIATLLLINKIREISHNNSWVGPHCTSILLPPPSNPNILVEYHPADPSMLSDSQKLDDEEGAWAYSPWIISHNICKPPSQIIGGGFTITTGHFSIRFVSETPNVSGYLIADEGQIRKKLG